MTKGVKADIDWVLIKTAFTTSNKSLKVIADEFKVGYSHVRAKASQEKWALARQEFVQTIAKQVESNALTKRLKALDDMNERDMKVAGALISHVSIKLQKSLKRKEGTNEIEDSTLSARELSALAAAHGQAQKANRLAIGASTENNAFAGQVIPADPAAVGEVNDIDASRTYQMFITGSNNSG